MTSPRSEVYDPQTPQYYHCFSRCVRRAFLCGWDARSGRSFEHRREWIRARLAELGGIFSIEIGAYAVMENHLHTVLRNRPDLAKLWTAEEVARRWRLLFPKRRERDGSPATLTNEEVRVITSDAKLVELYRQRLSCLSWFHRCMNESIARRANKEDDCTGRFWEGRFRSEPLTNTGAVIACSAYVDLNPIRAGIAPTPEESAYTAVRQRIVERSDTHEVMQSQVSLLSIAELSEGSLTEDDYLTLVDETGRLIREGKEAISADLVPILARLSLRDDNWLTLMSEKKRIFRRAIGPVESLRALAQKFGKHWFQGLTGAKLIFV